MKGLILLLAVALAGCATPKKSAFVEPPGWNPQPLGPVRNTFAEIVERGRREQAAQAEAAAAAREEFIATHPELTERQRELIRTSRYALGWSREMVRASMGEPQRISQTVSAFGRLETWSYRSGIQLLQFLNGSLTSFHLDQ